MKTGYQPKITWVLGVFREAYKRCRPFGSNVGLWKGVRIAAVVVVVSASGYYLTRNILRGYSEVRATSVQINGMALLISTVITASCTLLGGWEWKLLLEALGYEGISIRKAVKIHVMANIVKYAPGYAWQILGKAYLARKENIPQEYVVPSIGAEFALIIISGGLLALLMLPGALFVQQLSFSALAAQGLAISVVVLFFLLFPWVIRAVMHYIEKHNLWRLSYAVDSRKLAWVLLAMLLTWALMGVGFCFLIAGVYSLRLSDIPTYVFSLAVSLAMGLLVVFVPNGIGVREGILATLLSSSMPLAMASIIAILARLILMLAETISFFIVWRL